MPSAAQIEATRRAARQGGIWHLPNCSRKGCGHHPDKHVYEGIGSPFDEGSQHGCTECDCEDFIGVMTRGAGR